MAEYRAFYIAGFCEQVINKKTLESIRYDYLKFMTFYIYMSQREPLPEKSFAIDFKIIDDEIEGKHIEELGIFKVNKDLDTLVPKEVFSPYANILFKRS